MPYTRVGVISRGDAQATVNIPSGATAASVQSSVSDNAGTLQINLKAAVESIADIQSAITGTLSVSAPQVSVPAPAAAITGILSTITTDASTAANNSTTPNSNGFANPARPRIPIFGHFRSPGDEIRTQRVELFRTNQIIQKILRK